MDISSLMQAGTLYPEPLHTATKSTSIMLAYEPIMTYFISFAVDGSVKVSSGRIRLSVGDVSWRVSRQQTLLWVHGGCGMMLSHCQAWHDSASAMKHSSVLCRASKASPMTTLRQPLIINPSVSSYSPYPLPPCSVMNEGVSSIPL